MIKSPLLNTNQSGFTLVEVAVVTVAIGLLIFGVLGVREMIINARLVSTMQQVQSYQAAIKSFRKAYGVLPGDIMDPANRLPACDAGGSCNVPGNGTGNIGGVGVTRTGPFLGYSLNTANNVEGRTVWTHLAAGGFIGSVIDRTSTSMVKSWGVQFPTTPLGGGVHVIEMRAGGDMTGTPDISGRYFYLRQTVGGDSLNAEPNDGALFTPVFVAAADQKFDDGFPDTGNIIGMGTGCQAVGANNVYTFARSDRLDCGMLIGESTF
jgi:prepilin-type N-terminal cleavage/methylation domain-containing protein